MSEAILRELDAIDAASERIRLTLAAPPPPAARVVRAGENLQAALDEGGTIAIEAGATFIGTYLVKSNTVLSAQGPASIFGQTAEALIIPPGTLHVAIDGPLALSGPRVALRVGANDPTQTTLADVPDGLVLHKLIVTGMRGKRAFEIHGRNVLIDECRLEDIYDPGGQDSQAICLVNTPGGVHITRNVLSAGSEVILSGGDHTRIPGVVPTSILIEGNDIYRPLSWKTDGTARKVKNLIELKNGRSVRIVRNQIHGCWANGQAGEAFMLTPAIGGAKTTPISPSGLVGDVLIEDNDVYDCGSICNMTGRDYAAYTSEKTTGIVFRNNRLTANRGLFGGRGELATIGNDPGVIEFHDNTVTVDGSSLVYFYRGSVAQQDGSLRVGEKLGGLRLTGNTVRVVGPYGLNLGGYANAREWQAQTDELVVTGNRFAGSTAMKSLFPENEWSAA